MPLLETKGAASAQGFGLTLGGAAPVYIEDVFSTWLYTGNNSTQTITNGIDLSGKGGLVWLKRRNAADSNWVSDTTRGFGNFLNTDSTFQNQNLTSLWSTSVSSSGFSFNTANSAINASTSNYTSWTFRKQPKFFDVVTYTGNGAQRNIAHSLGSAPGSIFVKRTDSTGDWAVWHRSLAAGDTDYLLLNTTAAKATDLTYWYGSGMTSTTFAVGTNANVNASGGTYVAYLFAHDAGGFGLTGTDNVISCGSYVGNGSATGPTVTLGYEPQWILVKSATSAENWIVADVMRNMPASDDAGTAQLFPNLSDAENSNWGQLISPTATGFLIASSATRVNDSGKTYIYIAIRRGPMKTPTSGTSVFNPSTRTGTSSTSTVISTTIVSDLLISSARDAGATGGGSIGTVLARLLGGKYSQTINTNAEAGRIINWGAAQTAFTNTTTISLINYSPTPEIDWNFGRAPGFFDVVCYTGNGTANRSVSHNLGVPPELVIIKGRNATPGNADSNWSVNTSTAIATAAGRPSANYLLFLNGTSAWYNWGAPWFGTASLTSTTFPVTEGSGGSTCNGSGTNYVAYLFASCPGVSKVGSYTGTGATQTINCGFTGGARFVLIKRTDSTGDWYVWDTARGMVAGTDPSLVLNLNNPEVNANSVYTTSAGFQIVSTAAGINASGGTYIFLAIA